MSARRCAISELAYVNGWFGPIEEAKVSIEDRGFQFGDGVYEVVVSYDGRLFLLDEHLERFSHSLAAIGMNLDPASLREVIEVGVARSGFSDVLVYIQVTRGVAPRHHVIPEDIEPTVVMTFKARPQVPNALRERGVSLMTVPNARWSQCHIKAITLLPNVLARSEAVRKGYDDALFVTERGDVLEATAANIFMVQGGRLLTPPRDEAVLHGITQGFIIECARAIGLPLSEGRITLSGLFAADEAFLSSTTVEVLPVTRVDDRPIGTGRVGELTRRMHEEFRRRARGNHEPVAA